MYTIHQKASTAASVVQRQGRTSPKYSLSDPRFALFILKICEFWIKSRLCNSDVLDSQIYTLLVTFSTKSGFSFVLKLIISWAMKANNDDYMYMDQRAPLRGLKSPWITTINTESHLLAFIIHTVWPERSPADRWSLWAPLLSDTDEK